MRGANGSFSIQSGGNATRGAPSCVWEDATGDAIDVVKVSDIRILCRIKPKATGGTPCGFSGGRQGAFVGRFAADDFGWLDSLAFLTVKARLTYDMPDNRHPSPSACVFG